MFDSGQSAQAANVCAFYVQIMFLQDSGDHYWSCLALSHLEDEEHIHKNRSQLHTDSLWVYKNILGTKIPKAPEGSPSYVTSVSSVCS